MTENDYIRFMRRCLELAVKAEGMTYPNPVVGSVVVHNGEIIGEGFHLKSGEPHAEVIAINSVKDKSKLPHSTLFVNLEPCSHFGKTPPCSDFIVANKIPRVVVGTIDTSSKVSGEGLDRLRKGGCNVVTRIAEDECRIINRRFFTFHEKRRPYIILKWAQSADGFIDIIRPEGHKVEPNWITGGPERVLVHKWRASEQAILVGAETVRSDNPKLNVREWMGANPLKIVVSSSGSFSKESSVYESKGEVIVFTHNINADLGKALKVKLDNNNQAALQIAEYLFNKGIQSLLIEGGAKILNHFICSNLWDEARVFTGSRMFGNGVKAPETNGSIFSNSIFSGSSLDIYFNKDWM